MAHRSRSRREEALRRPRPTRRPAECLLVVCEGVETEPNYLKSFRKQIGLTTVEVEIVGQGAEVVGVVDAALRLRARREEEARISTRRAPFDETWCVADTERKSDHPSWERGLRKARDHEISLAWSNPCFEYWILLHFERIGRSFDGYAALRPCLKRHIPDYEKNLDCFDRLAPRVSTAIENSRHIHRSQWQDTPREIDRNPATTVHELVERLIAIAGMTVEEYGRKFPMPPTVASRARRPSRGKN